MLKPTYEALASNLKNHFDKPASSEYGVRQGMNAWVSQSGIPPSDDTELILCMIRGIIVGKNAPTVFYPYQIEDRTSIINFLSNNTWESFVQKSVHIIANMNDELSQKFKLSA